MDAILRRMVCEQEVAMEGVCTNIDNNQLLGSGPRSARDRGREPANHSEAAAFSPSPGKFKPRKP
ncbi:hypothetical protein E2C01_047546 [Portunus trituberculatus]|uniref:Uncharacterized protein n=1 Tax=Portunus trituberculatus TaxID=210409 RepID=A0A5B7G969_PORTR|nr:hypothetical protein [Portunus trituberculatus]